MGRLRLATLGVVAAMSLMLAPATAIAAGFASFGVPTASGSFGEDIQFQQTVTVTEAVSRAELLVTYADAIGPTVYEVAVAGGPGPLQLSYRLPVATEGDLLPNTPLTGAWRVFPANGGDPVVGPDVALTYADERFDWRTRSGDVVRVHWYEGSDAFGQRALEIAEQGIEQASQLLGVTEDEPVDFFIYADERDFRDALGAGTRENVGGQANAEIRTLFALISPSEIGDRWVEIVIPHELMHLVFDTAVDNPYHFPPRWLNEGLAVYESEGYGATDRRDVERAARDGSLIPLTGLTGQFPTTADRFRLAYSESASSVDYLIRTYGKDVLVGLIGSYADGRTDDEAFQAAIGMSVQAFSDAWLADLDATVPERRGPQPAPAGPVPSAWSTDTGAVPVPPAGPGVSASAGASAAPTAPTDEASTDGGSGIVILAAVVVGIAVATMIGYAAYRRRDAAG
jgi:Peptidase MA superfamily